MLWRICAKLAGGAFLSLNICVYVRKRATHPAAALQLSFYNHSLPCSLQYRMQYRHEYRTGFLGKRTQPPWQIWRSRQTSLPRRFLLLREPAADDAPVAGALAGIACQPPLPAAVATCYTRMCVPEADVRALRVGLRRYITTTMGVSDRYRRGVQLGLMRLMLLFSRLVRLQL